MPRYKYDVRWMSLDRDEQSLWPGLGAGRAMTVMSFLLFEALVAMLTRPFTAGLFTAYSPVH